MIQNPKRIVFFLTLSYVCLSFFLAQNQNKAPADVYNKTDSKQYAYYAVLAYCPKKCLEAWDCLFGKNLTNFGEVSHISNIVTLASCYIGYQKVRNLIIVSFRGSANAQNWIEDFNFEKTSYSACKSCEIHAGFYQDYKVIQQKINEKVQKLLEAHPTASILTTGHSMGAALSVIAGLRLKAKFNKKITVHNYGCPRVANAALAQYINTRVDTIYRVVHNRDLIAHLPPQPFEYHHTAYQVFWNEDMTSYTICSQTGEDKTCSNKFAPEYSAADHSFYFFSIDSKTLKC